MRVLTLIFFTVSIFFSSFSAHALDGIPAAYKVGETDLVLNGSGKRTRFVVTVYNAGLYVKNKTSDPKVIIDANETMAIRLKIKSGFASAKKIEDALTKGVC